MPSRPAGTTPLSLSGSSSWIVRLINIVITVLLIALCAAVYWFAVRPMPKTTGELRLPISGMATVRRDARGVPHIEAATWQDAMFLQGYVTAQDRLWQMDGLRRYGSGTLAEISGPGAVPLDELSRKMRMRAVAEADVRHLTPEERIIFVEYARGVNEFIDTHQGKYSLEFSLPGHVYDPKPWTLEDSAVVGLVLYRNLTDNAAFKYSKARFMDMADGAKSRMLFPALEGELESPGSNAWAVSGAHTASGRPLLANDPHLAFGIPPTWYLVHVKAPGLNVSGASLPGLPCVIVGHNEQIAWGVTNLETDSEDLYREQLDERTGRYLFKGEPAQAQLDRQIIGVKGAKSVVLDTWVTRHGPVVISEGGKMYSMRWTAQDGFAFPFLDLNRAGNWSQFRQAVGRFWGPPQNFVYADRAGNIGYQAGGRMPLVRAAVGDLPLDGASGNFEWNGYVPFERMPSTFNPAEGVIATANQNPFPASFEFPLAGRFEDKYRVEQIKRRLLGKPKLTVDDMLAIQKDVYSAFNDFLAKQASAAFDHQGSNDDLVRAAVPVLRKWNGQMDKDESAPFITELLHEQLAIGLMRAALKQPGSGTMPEIRPKPEQIERVLRARPRGWVAKDDWDSWALQTLAAALQNGRAAQGSPVRNWKWGRARTWSLMHPVGKQLPLVSGFFNIGPVPMSGSGTTIKQTTDRIGPSERLVVDLGDLDRSVQNVTTGESGFVASLHYKDEWDAYYTGTSFPMQFGKVDAKDTLTIKPSRVPASE